MRNNSKSVWDIRLPEPTSRLHGSHLRQPPTWKQFLSEIEGEWSRYMREHDSPEQRVTGKISERFVFQ